MTYPGDCLCGGVQFRIEQELERPIDDTLPQFPEACAPKPKADK